MVKEFSKAFMIYKARNDGTGSASQWNLASDKKSVFLEMANQIGFDDNKSAKFDWDNKIAFKLGEKDIGEFLAVLTGLQNGVGPFDDSKKKHKGLFHSNQSGNAILYFGRDEYKKFHIYLSVKRGKEKSVVRHTMSKGEACVFAVVLRRAIEVIYRWA